MSVRSDLLDELLAWVETQLSISGAGASPQVILVQRGDKSPRLPLPYLTLNFNWSDAPVGTNESSWEDEVHRLGGNRQGMLEIRGLGPGSDAWLEELGFRVDTFDGNGTIVADNRSRTRDVSVLIDESFEEQYIKEFLFEYKVRDSETAPTADISTITVHDAADTITITTVIDWESP